MSKYVITDTTLSNIADAIRAKTGKADMITPEQMPTEIADITTGVDVTLLDNINIILDFANGNQIVVAQEGYAVKGATILKPATLIPENIAEGVEIAGVVGTHAGGGGSSADVHYVTFTNASTGETYVKPVAHGDDCVDPVVKGLWKTPTQESTAAEDFDFSGSWSATPGGAADANILKNITEDKTVYAVFTATVRYYTITWLDDDGVTELPGQKQWAYGTVPSYEPKKDGYVFVRWNPATSTVVGNTTYTAVWEEATVRWELSGTSLRIFGYGEMPQYAERPWEESASLITEVIVEAGVTTISGGAFKNLTALKSVSITDSVTSIGMNAFNGCTSLTAVSIPEGVTEISVGAFQLCNKLAEVSLPDSLTKIGNQAFSGTALVSLTIPDGMTSLGQIVPNVTTLTSVIIGAKVKSITMNAFYGCTNLANVTFKDTSGWYVTQTSGASSGTSISSSNLADTAKAATYLKNTYRAYYWYDKT